MKKVIIIILILLLLCGCTVHEKDQQFIILESYPDTILVYSTSTGAMYYSRGHGLSPCYVWDEEKQDFHVGHYPEDWEAYK